MLTIDHLRVDHRVTVLREFSEVSGTTMHVGETGVIRDMSWNQLTNEIHIVIARNTGGDDEPQVRLAFSLKATSGPRNAHMREYFEIGEYVVVPGEERVPPPPAEKKMIIPPPERKKSAGPRHWEELRSTEGPDHQEEAENALRAEIQHIGVASSIAEMYAQRMRAFQAEGNEARAVAAFKLATQWMSTYAGWATSGGEGAALSRERDEFHDGLVREFGYDPTLEDK